MTDIHTARILIIADEGFEESELLVPRDKLRAAGARVDVASPDGEPIRSWAENDWGEAVKADLAIADVRRPDYHALVIPGGRINPDKLRTEPAVVELVREFFDAGAPVAAICHGPWLLVEADVLRGRKATSWPSLATDIRNAGGEWVDAEVIADQGVVTSRKPDDLDAFVAKIIEEVEEGRHLRGRAA
jgi:intracellular protease, PfpI family